MALEFNQSNQARPSTDGSVIRARTSFGKFSIRITPCDGFGNFCGDYTCMRIQILNSKENLALDDAHVPLSMLSNWALVAEKLRKENKEVN